MKKKMVLALCALLLMLPTLACAEAVSITELREQVEEMGRWTQTYEAYGRTIEVDAPIDVPAVDVFPVIRVCGYRAIEQGKLARDGSTLNQIGENGILLVYEEDGLTAYLGAEGERIGGEITAADPEEDESVILIADYQGPSHLRTHKVKVKTEAYLPEDVRAEDIHAEENPWPASSAMACLQETLDYFYPNSENTFALRFLDVLSRGRSVKGLDDDKLGDCVRDYPMGTYLLRFCQTMHGIPVYHDVGERLDTTGYDPEGIVDEAWQKAAPIMRLSDNRFEWMNSGRFELLVRWMREMDVVQEDVPLASLESVLGSLEAAIQAGHIRRVYALRLGYGCYVTDESPDAFCLYPVWICDCDYIEAPKEEINPVTYAYGDSFHESYCFKTLTVNAQTGKLDDIWLTQRDQVFCPPILTWDAQPAGL